MKRRYNAHHPLPFELRAACVLKRMQGATLQSVADLYDVSATSVFRWEMDFKLRRLSTDDLSLLKTTDLGQELLRVLR